MYLRQAIMESIANREKTGTVRNDLIDILITLKKETEYQFTPDMLLAQAAIFILAGHHSTANTVAIALYHLARNPQMLDRTREEIKSALKSENGQPTYDVVMHQMPYLDMVIYGKNGFRHGPPNDPFVS